MLKRFSFRIKLVTLVAAVSGLTVSASFAIFVWWDLKAFRQKLIDEKRYQSEIVSTNSGAALLFGDAQAAGEILKSLKYHDDVESAQIFLPDGKVLAQYTKNERMKPLSVAPRMIADVVESGERLITKSPIRQEREYVGDLVVVSSMRPWIERRDAFIAVTSALTLLSLIASVLIAANLQRIISGPILRLAEAMRLVSRTRDYRHRVDHVSNDEVGQLAAGFNAMLSEIQTRDEALQLAKEELEERVRLRTAELQKEVLERQAREADARSSQKQLSDFFDTAPIGIVRLDDQGRILVANQAQLDIYGFESHALLGRHLNEFHVDTDDLNDLLEKLRNGETVHNYEGVIRRADGERRVVQINATPYWQADRFVYAGLFTRDITVIRRAQEAERAKERAERANQAKNEFLSRMSHELRTPMNSILGFSQLLEMEPLDDRARECVDQILKGGKHLLNLINEVLNISRIESGHVSVSLEPIEVSTILREAIDLVAPMAAEHGIRLINDVPSDAGYVQADRQRLSQVILNLLTNAVKYNSAGGEVRCALQAAENGHVALSVTDTGQGIAPENLERLFVPFDRLGAENSAVEGTGLGLPLSKSLVDAMRGRLYLDLEHSGPGSRFVIELAQAEAPSGSVPLGLMEFDLANASPTQTQTVLLIEDNMANVKLIEQLLHARPGIRLLVAMQGHLGLEFAREHHPDAILLDNNLPDMLGIQVAEKLSNDRALSQIPVVLLSADPTVQHWSLPGRGKPVEVLSKPFEVGEFLDVLDRVLEREVRLSA
ncbi:MAG TPA: ATP-binding protein [Fimbriimonadaceae bacterium]|nr:ATP-binding protein [Fimbriimonadaceae bacterium]